MGVGDAVAERAKARVAMMTLNCILMVWGWVEVGKIWTFVGKVLGGC